MSGASLSSPGALANKRDYAPKSLLILALLTLFAFLLMGYHPGLEDDSFYLAAIKRHLNPSLFPYDADYFRLQFQATLFDKLIAGSVRLTHLPLAWVALLCQLTVLFFLLHGCWRIACRCFLKPEAQWAATVLVAVLLTMPIGGIAISLADQYLHPRTLATAVILAAVVAVMDRRHWLAALLLAFAFSVHAIQACFGISFCLFLAWQIRARKLSWISAPAAALFPLGWLFEPSSEAWRQAASTRGFYFLAHWAWYEWLGVLAPLLLLLMLLRFLGSLRRYQQTAIIPLVAALLCYGAFQMVVGLIVMLPQNLERLRPFEPMRYLHLLYILFFLIAGGLLGEHVLRRRAYRWALLFLPLSAGMLYAQRQSYPASPHLELPLVRSQNHWVQAFAWIRENTSVDSVFAIDPHYEIRPGEDQHGFRALAERSVLADYEKDAGMAARVPRLAPRWWTEVKALNGWQHFQPADFDRLHREFGVTWFVFSRADDHFSSGRSDHLRCPYQNEDVQVCQLY